MTSSIAWEFSKWPPSMPWFRSLPPLDFVASVFPGYCFGVNRPRFIAAILAVKAVWPSARMSSFSCRARGKALCGEASAIRQWGEPDQIANGEK